MHGHLSGWDPSVMWGSASQGAKAAKAKNLMASTMLLPSSQRSPLKLKPFTLRV